MELKTLNLRKFECFFHEGRNAFITLAWNDKIRTRVREKLWQREGLAVRSAEMVPLDSFGTKRLESGKKSIASLLSLTQRFLKNVSSFFFFFSFIFFFLFLKKAFSRNKKREIGEHFPNGLEAKEKIGVDPSGGIPRYLHS